MSAPSGTLPSSASALGGSDYATHQLAAFRRHPLLVHAHAVVGIALLLTVPFQFWRRFRNDHRKLHRLMGYVAVGGLIALATSGLAVAIVYPFSGVAGMIPNFVWMTGILFCTGMAVASIRKREVARHQAWMTRAIAMTLGITLATIYLPLLTGPLHLPSRTALAVSFWLGVVECLVVAEFWLRRPGGALASRPAR